MKQLNFSKKLFMTLVIVLAFTCLVQAKVIYVDIDCTTGNNDGTSWSNAYRGDTCLQTALDAAVSGDEIRAADGTYKPSKRSDPNTARTETFQLITGVAIYGGYAGSSAPDAGRNIQTYKTILSGDIGSINDNSDNCFHVVTGSSTTSTAVLDGFTIKLGNANITSSSYYYGGGIYSSSGSSTISNCIFSGNSAQYGGGMFNNNSSPTISYCTFSSNTVTSYGGGMYNSSSSPSISNCIISSNTVNNYSGGGIANFGSGPMTCKNCIICENSVSLNGGGIYNFSGSLSIKNCTIYKNAARYGGALYNYSSDSNVTICNSILWNDTASSGGLEICKEAGTISVTFSDVRGGFPGTRNIEADPKFADPNGEDGVDGTADDNLRLCPWSPCIDAGDNSCYTDSQTDLDGNPRFIDDYSTTDTGSGTAPIIDMGAFEFQDPLRTHFLITDYRGYLGIGTPPKAALHIGSDRGLTISDTSDKALSWNAYYDNGWKYLGNDLAAQFSMDYANNKFCLNAAPIGQANGTVNWLNMLTIQADGKLGIGVNTPKESVQIGSGKGLTIHSGTDYAFSWNAYYDSGWKYLDSDYAYQLYAGSTADRLTVRTAASGQQDNSITWIDSLTYMANGNVAIGTTDSQGYKLAVKGSVIAESLTVKPYPEWPDNVFEPGYPLLPISDLDNYIKDKKSLPNIPTSEYIAEKGMNVGETQVKMLQKIEELTLYVIELKKKNDSLEKKNEAMEKKNESMEKRLTELEKGDKK